MALIYSPGIKSGSLAIIQSDEAHHLTRVLRKTEGDDIELCDGMGNLYIGRIITISKKQTEVQVSELLASLKQPESKLYIGIAPTKNISRFEWFLEKATETGVAGIIPLLTSHSERDKIKPERWEKIIISAMKQSKHLYKPELHGLTDFESILQLNHEEKFIAYSEKLPPDHLIRFADPYKESLVLVGPEGDFSKSEYEQALHAGFHPVGLGNHRLRTETAGLAVAQIFDNKRFI